MQCGGGGGCKGLGQVEAKAGTQRERWGGGGGCKGLGQVEAKAGTQRERWGGGGGGARG